MQKLLVFFLIGLFIILALEAGFFVNQKQTQKTPQITLAPVSSPTPTVFASNTTIVAVPDSAINIHVLQSLAKIHKGVLYSSTNTSEYRGNIINLTTNPLSAWSIRIKGNDQSNAFNFNDTELRMIKFDMINDKGSAIPITQNDLKINDKVSITITTDLMTNKSSMIKITKLP